MILRLVKAVELKLLAISRFKHHVWVDSSRSFLRNNKFLPEDKFYHAFLVDESNSILIVTAANVTLFSHSVKHLSICRKSSVNNLPIHRIVPIFA